MNIEELIRNEMQEKGYDCLCNDGPGCVCGPYMYDQPGECDMMKENCRFGFITVIQLSNYDADIQYTISETEPMRTRIDDNGMPINKNEIKEAE